MAETKEVVEKKKGLKDSVVQMIDQNGDGKIDIQDIITIGLNMPKVKINREEFLRKELARYYPEETIELAVNYTPAYAQIKPEHIDKIANEVIKYENLCVSGISTLLGSVGSLATVAAIATIPADIAQYYGYMLRTAQKLMYLYGFPQLNISENDANIDTQTMNILIFCLGVMYGDVVAKNTLLALSKALAVGVEKTLLKTALTKGTVYPLVKNIASKWFGVKMTKTIYANFFRKAIPVIGGLVGGAITFFTFPSCCKKLKNSLKDTYLSNPDCTLEPTLEIEEVGETPKENETIGV